MPMQKSIEAVFYQCEHTGAFLKGPAAVVNILKSHYGESCGAAPYTLSHFSSILGYRFIREGVTCFIPQSKTPPSSDGPFPFAPLLASKDLIVPPLLMPRHMMLICDAIRANERNPGGLTVDFCLAVIYTPSNMGRYFESLFSEIDSFRPYMQHIDECIRAYLFGYVSVAVSGLILASEGILREIGAKIDSRFEGITSKDQFINVLTKIEDILMAKAYPGVEVPGFMRLKEYMLGFDEQLCLVDNFREYFTTRLYEKTSEVEGAIDMNRHSVLHGLSMDFNKPINFYRLFIMLVFLAFVSVLLGHSRASSFVPDTERSKLKSDCYDKLAALGASMKVRFPI
ncbi:Uncharacterized protein ALO63_04081 [Pseudomonas amygdali pv. mori]|uniref:Uncharacterized protein n=1 Tax=Pseudomonas amygdali pv. mori TaxID=34065 RepID=A0A0N8S6S6_PSEA0|nr:Uncharacterized protein ALO63_04081 [Pseudomonas amygdali pv. mori]